VVPAVVLVVHVMVEADMARGQYLDPRAGRITFDEWAKECCAT
jgi:hypothetical protein